MAVNTVDEVAEVKRACGDRFETTAKRLFDAVDSGAVSVVQRLFAKRPALHVGLPVGNGIGSNLLHVAASHNQPRMVTALLGLCRTEAERASVLEHQDVFGDTPLISAARAPAPDAVRALIRAGADLSARNCNGTTALSVRSTMDEQPFRGAAA